MFAPTRIAVDYFFLQEFIMILRMWHGYTAPQNADAYHAMLQETILPGLDRVSGYRGAYVARRHVENEVEFMTLTLWDSMDAVHAFSADGRAVIHKAAAPLLSHYDEYSIHYDGTFVP
jgi:heme-degrading monooxygenase HmoA